MKVALQLFTLRDYLKTKDEIMTTLKRVKEVGYAAVQVSGLGDITKEKAEWVKQACEVNCLKICATHTGLSQLQSQFDWIVEYHKLWNCFYVGVGAMPAEYTHSEEKLIEFTHIMNDLGERLSKHGITLVYHNHAFEFKKYDSQIGMNILMDNFNSFVQFELDTYWVQKGAQNPVKWINNVAGRMDVVHYKDMGIKNWDEQYMESVGDGNLDWDEIIESSIKTGVKWACVEQDDCQGRDPFICIDNSLKYLKSKGL